MKHAVIYARYSSDKQNEMSITGQIKECRSYAKNPNLQEYPKKEVSAQFKDTVESIKEKNPKDYKVISDNENPGKYRIVTKNKEGKYETVKGNFDSRDLADKFRKNISEATSAIADEMKSIKNGIK